MTLPALGRPLLVYGIGNPGRQDDGLGPALVERLSAVGVPAGVRLESAYQLAPEDALLVAAHATVVFVDATADPRAPRPYSTEPVEPDARTPFTTPAMRPGGVLALCRRLYGGTPEAFALAIPASGFEVNAPLTADAAACLDRAVHDLLARLSAGAGVQTPARQDSVAVPVETSASPDRTM